MQTIVVAYKTTKMPGPTYRQAGKPGMTTHGHLVSCVLLLVLVFFYLDLFMLTSMLLVLR